MFDNGSDPPKEKQSRGLLLAPNTANHSVTLVKQFTNPTKTLLAESQGNLLQLSAPPGGNWLLGYGGLPNFTEFDASGHVLLDGTLGKNVQNFQHLPLAVERRSRRARRRWPAERRADGRGELERGDRRRLLAGPRRVLADDARAGRERREERLSDDDLAYRRARLRGRAGARRQRRGARHLAHDQGLSAGPPASSAARRPRVGARTRDARFGLCRRGRERTRARHLRSAARRRR